MFILVINCGSSSAKYDLFDVDGKSSDLCRGIVERIGEDSATLTHEIMGEEKVHRKVSCRDHHQAIEIIRDALIDEKKSVLRDTSEVKGVGHRVVHGGEEFSESTLINENVLKSIEKFSELAPLHNPPSLEGIKSCMKIFQGVPQAAVFDTAFHHSMSKHVFCYGIPYEYYEKYGIRRYGFHGTSHRYVANKTAEILKKPIEKLKTITVHLGNGCSIAAVSGAKSIDTSMGFTPLEGLLMGTRSGDIDPAVVTFLMQRERVTDEQVNDILNKKSGLLGVSGVSNDMRDILGAIKKGNTRAKLAYDIFVYRIKKYIGAYAAVLGRVDAVVFTAGIGENLPRIKDDLQKELRPLLGENTRFLIVKTNEELLIAKDTYELVSRLID
ncbi:MAG: acetate kinase [Candidatus Omnitrophota bacterium]|nr:acetate kinase [Candidatus Omnitrophota bacterium]MBU1895061.1 acetate kinase [Candidatus Omnitrophota bacterium]